MPTTEPRPAVNGEDGVAAQVPQEFSVTDAASANWVVRRILQARAYAARVADWADAEQRRARREEDFFLGRFGSELEAWLIRELQARRSKQKSVNLPAGRVGRRRIREKLVVEDEQAVLAWAREHLPDAIHLRETVRKSALHERFFTTGELPPGLAVLPAQDSLVIT